MSDETTNDATTAGGAGEDEPDRCDRCGGTGEVYYGLCRGCSTAVGEDGALIWMSGHARALACRLAEIRERAEKATPGPWRALPTHNAGDAQRRVDRGGVRDERMAMMNDEIFRGQSVGRWLTRADWYSVCSRHRHARTDCELCMMGNYVKRFPRGIGHAVYVCAPWLWRWWANRPQSKARMRLERMFSGLRGKD